MTNLKHIIGKRIHSLRTEHQLTQAQFAELIDISVNFLSEIENGKKGISQDTLYKLCSKFSISADYILFGTQPTNPPLSSAEIIQYINHLDAKELDTLLKYIVSLQELRKSITP